MHFSETSKFALMTPFPLKSSAAVSKQNTNESRSSRPATSERRNISSTNNYSIYKIQFILKTEKLYKQIKCKWFSRFPQESKAVFTLLIVTIFMTLSVYKYWKIPKITSRYIKNNYSHSQICYCISSKKKTMISNPDRI